MYSVECSDTEGVVCFWRKSFDSLVIYWSLPRSVFQERPGISNPSGSSFPSVERSADSRVSEQGGLSYPPRPSRTAGEQTGFCTWVQVLSERPRWACAHTRNTIHSLFSRKAVRNHFCLLFHRIPSQCSAGHHGGALSPNSVAISRRENPSSGSRWRPSPAHTHAPERPPRLCHHGAGGY